MKKEIFMVVIYIISDHLIYMQVIDLTTIIIRVSYRFIKTVIIFASSVKKIY